MHQIIRLYRISTKLDLMNNYILTSNNTSSLNQETVLGEMLSHEFNATSKRGVFFSFTTRLNIAERYATKEKSKRICYIDIDLNNIDPAIVSIHPLFELDFWCVEIARSPQIMIQEFIVNPSTGHRSSILGIVNVAQKSAASWSHSMYEVMIQCDKFALKPVESIDNTIAYTTTENLLKHHFLSLSAQNAAQFESVIRKSFEVLPNLRRKYILTHITNDAWYNAT